MPRAVELGAAAVLWTAFVVGISVLTLTVPFLTSTVSDAIGVAASSGLPAADVTVLSEAVRSFVADPEAGVLPAEWKGQPAFGHSEIGHLRDVRAVLSGARVATGVAALLLAAYVAWCVAKRRLSRLRRGMACGAAVTAGLVSLAALTSLVDFSSFFTAFHGLFFADGTWTFPYDSLLIMLFPEPFWVAAGVAWAALCLAAAAVLGLASWLLRGAATNKGASRSANNV